MSADHNLTYLDLLHIVCIFVLTGYFLRKITILQWIELP